MNSLHTSFDSYYKNTITLVLSLFNNVTQMTTTMNIEICYYLDDTEFFYSCCCHTTSTEENQHTVTAVRHTTFIKFGKENQTVQKDMNYTVLMNEILKICSATEVHLQSLCFPIFQ